MPKALRAFSAGPASLASSLHVEEPARERGVRMTKAQTARVVNATVHLDGKGGQGVLVAGGFILTAAHCIQWNGDGEMTMGDHFIETITTKAGAHLRVGPLAADPVSDIAVLGSLDDQDFFDDWMEFEEWSEATAAVPLANTTPRYRAPLDVHVLTHKGKWIEGAITRYAVGPIQSGRLCIEAQWCIAVLDSPGDRNTPANRQGSGK